MRHALRSILPFALVLAVAVPARAADAPLGPEETVRRYLTALKAGKFDDAYELVSKAMRLGKPKEVWVREMREAGQTAEVKIFAFDVGTGQVEGDTAKVPNVLESQDRFINQMGLTEYELYTLVKEDGRWKVDQQVLVEPPDLPRWFPKLKKSATDRPAAGGAPAAR